MAEGNVTTRFYALDETDVSGSLGLYGIKSSLMALETIRGSRITEHSDGALFTSKLNIEQLSVYGSCVVAKSGARTLTIRSWNDYRQEGSEHLMLTVEGDEAYLTSIDRIVKLYAPHHAE